ncbi:MAG: hypothetical protein JXP48_06955 [Acidobacteria bacterium]|nr:hypothetical protein [Acidobacteriota bacterium]
MGTFHSIRLALLWVLAAQSLADVASREAERRERVDAQERVERVIDGDPSLWAPGGNVTRGTPPAPAPVPDALPPGREGAKSLRHYQGALRKLDQAIRREERQLALRRERLEAGRRLLPGTGPLDARAGSRRADARGRLEAEIGEIGEKLGELRRERAECYDEGRRAGYLPGELDGRGVR